MKVLVISDVHANLTALESVLNDAGKVDAVWCLGDVIGYGPDPNECVEKIRTLPNLVCIIGNHDAAVIGELDTVTFNPEAKKSIEWQKSKLNSDNADFIKALVKQVVIDKVTLVHGSPRSPIHEYLLNTYLATVNFSYFTTDYCFVGHTHLPVQFYLGKRDEHAQLLYLKENAPMVIPSRSIINPGSVGQPRDGDPRAAYMIYYPEKETLEHRRVKYNIKSVQERMRKSGLPDPHIERLNLGW